MRGRRLPGAVPAAHARCSPAGSRAARGCRSRWTFPLALLLRRGAARLGRAGLPVVPARLHAARATCRCSSSRALGSVDAGDAVARWCSTCWCGARARGAARRARRSARRCCWRCRGRGGRACCDAAPPAHGPGRWRWSRATSPARSSGRASTSSEILDTFLALSRARRARHRAAPAIVIWPETATGTLPATRARAGDRGARLRRARQACRCSAASPTTDRGPDGRPQYLNARRRCSCRTARCRRCYAKRHLVPFGERMPFQWLVPALGKLELGQAEWTPGVEPVLFPSGAGPFACLICFESIFPDLGARRRAARRDAGSSTSRTTSGSAAAGALPARGDGGVPRRREPRAARALREHRAHADRRMPTAASRRGCRCGRRRAGGAARRPRHRRRLYTRLGDWPGAASPRWCVAIGSSRGRAAR